MQRFVEPNFFCNSCGGCEECFTRVLFFHRLPIALVEMALQIMKYCFYNCRLPASIAALISIFLMTAGFTYQLALPGGQLSFPADHYSHPDFKTEWWYYTGHLQTESGKRYGYQVTFFRFGVRDRQKDVKDKPPLFSELYMAHFALSDINAKKFSFS